jgi:hypothetical protein
LGACAAWILLGERHSLKCEDNQATSDRAKETAEEKPRAGAVHGLTPFWLNRHQTLRYHEDCLEKHPLRFV